MALDAREREGFVRSWGNVLMKSWEDDDFKARFRSDPAAVLNENGVEIQEGASVELVEPPADAGPDLDKQIDAYEAGPRERLVHLLRPGDEPAPDAGGLRAGARGSLGGRVLLIDPLLLLLLSETDRTRTEEKR